MDPPSPDQVPTPAEQRLGMNEEPPQAPAAKKPTQSGEQSPVAGSQRRAGHLAAKHGHFVSEHDDLDCQFAVLRAAESKQLEDSDESQVEEGERHGSVST